MRFMLSREPTSDGSKNLVYKIQAIVESKTQRNIAIELCEILKAFGASHLKALSKALTHRITQYAESISNFCLPKAY